MIECNPVLSTGGDWQTAATDYGIRKADVHSAGEKLDAAKARLIALATHNSETGAGVTVTRFWKAGNVAYAKVPELAGVDLERYRGKEREEVRVTLSQ